MGLLCKVARYMGDGNVDAYGGGGGACEGEKVNGNVKWTAAGLVREPRGGFLLDIVFCVHEVSQGCQELEDREEGIANVVVEGTSEPPHS